MTGNGIAVLQRTGSPDDLFGWARRRLFGEPHDAGIRHARPGHTPFHPTAHPTYVMQFREVGAWGGGSYVVIHGVEQTLEGVQALEVLPVAV